MARWQGCAAGSATAGLPLGWPAEGEEISIPLISYLIIIHHQGSSRLRHAPLLNKIIFLKLAFLRSNFNITLYFFVFFVCVFVCGYSVHIRTHKSTYELTNHTKLKSISMDLIWLKWCATPVRSRTC